MEADETICEVSTDKIDTEVPSPAAGRVTEVLVEVDTTVDVGTVLARIATDASPGEAHADEHLAPDAAAAEPRDAGTTEADAAKAPPSPTAAPKPEGNGHAARRYSPVVQRIAAEHGVDLDQVEGTGRGGRVRKQDVLAFVGAAVPRNRRAPRCTSRAPTARSPSPSRSPSPPRRAARRSRACAARSART